jgi:hypothetical protein
MFRKLIIAVAAVATVAAASLAVPTAASAGWKGHHGHHGWHGTGFRVGFYAPGYAAYGSDCYVVRRVVYTPYGKRLRRVTVCN